MYKRQSRLSDQKRDQLIEKFVAGTTGRVAAELVGVHRNTAASFYTRLRKVITEEMEKEMKTALPVGGEIEVRVMYFRSICSGPGRGAAGKVPIFGLLKRVANYSTYGRGQMVHTVMIPNARTATLMSIMKRLILPHSVVYTDNSLEYDALDVSDFNHVRPKNPKGLFDLWGIRHFEDEAEVFLTSFHGIPKQSFHLFLKEFEWRYNNGQEQGQEALTNQLKAWVRLRQKRT